MNINITDQAVSNFISGLILVLALLAVGALLLAILRKIERTLPFTRIGLTVALAPLCLINFLGYGSDKALLIYSMIATLMGITIDGVNHVLMPKEKTKAPANTETQEEDSTKPGVIVWEKAE